MIGQELSDLISKYASGRLPPLVDLNDLKRGLINGELLKIYQKGFAGRHLIPLGILVARPGYPEGPSKWNNADYHQNLAAEEDWTQVCRAIRSRRCGDQRPGDNCCEQCDRRHAAQAAKEGTVIAYLCDHGMVDFATPIFLDNEIVAVIFTGQRVPKKGTYWNADSVKPDGVFGPPVPGQPQVQAWQATLERLARAEKEYGFLPGELLNRLEQDIAKYATMQVGPEDVAHIQEWLTQAADHLSDLAQSTYALEKGKALAATRALIASSVADFRTDLDNISTTVDSIIARMDKAAQAVCRYFGLDYLFIVTVDSETRRFRVLLAQTPHDPPRWSPGEWSQELQETVFSPFSRRVEGIKARDEANLFDFRDLPFFDSLPTVGKGKSASRYFAARLDRPGLAPCVLLAGRKHGLVLAELRTIDAEDLQQVVDDFGAVTNIIQFVEALHAVSESQGRFLEEVAHDIRNPIQTILFRAALLEEDAPESIRPGMRKLAAQIRRIHRLSEKVWLLDQLRQGRFKLDTKGRVNVYATVMEAVAMVRDPADEKGLTISVNPDLQSWRSIQVDRDLFFQTMLNLLDNAVKYSFDDREVYVDGEMSKDCCRISVVNRGIGIKDQEQSRVFHRGYRTPEAMSFVQQGSGIGLCIVKEFADRYGKVEFKSSPITGTRHFVTEFRLILEKGVTWS